MENELVAEASEQVEQEERQAIVDYLKRQIRRSKELQREIDQVQKNIDAVRQGDHEAALRDCGRPF